MEDNKVLHMEMKEVEDFTNNLRNIFGEVVVTRGKNHTLWGMNIYITKDKKVDIDRKDKLLEVIEAYIENLDEKATTPASSPLVVVNKQAKRLDEEKRKIFHSLVIKLL